VSGPKLFADLFGAISLSINQGQSWTAANSGLTHLHVFSLPVIGPKLCASASGGGVEVSQ